MSDLNNKLIQVEEYYDKKMGSSNKFLCFSMDQVSQIISSLIIFDVFMFYLQTYARWGAPCFIWWKHISTTITFILGNLTRLIGIPVGVYSLISIKKQNDNGIRILFHYLLVLTMICMMDLILCLFEVHDVCNSDEMINWHICSHQWGKQLYECKGCNVDLKYNNLEEDKKLCLKNSSCEYIKIPNNERVKPQCCLDSYWHEYYQCPCSKEPTIRSEYFDSSWCEQFSDLYDIGFGSLTSFVLLGFSYIIHSYRNLLKDPLFTENPMNDD